LTTDQLRELVRTRPFIPFVIHVADGRSIEVSHPEMIAYGGGRIAVIAKPDDRF
jgi:hypothetical protein